MKYFIDTEFIDQPYTVDLISIALVAEDGREYYAESDETDWSRASQWTLTHVKPQLDGAGTAIHRHRDGGAGGVLAGVRQRLLHDPVRAYPYARRYPAQLVRCRKLDVHARLPGGVHERSQVAQLGLRREPGRLVLA